MNLKMDENTKDAVKFTAVMLMMSVLFWTLFN